jgi:hypothetical protein
MTYAMLVTNLDTEEREKFDAELNGYADQDKRALARLLGMPADGSGER